jgi:PAS domain S-box-containing protein
LRILIIDDSEDDAALLVRHFRDARYDTTWKRVDSAEAMREALLSESWDAVLCDHRMPGFNAMGALALLQELHLDLPFIIVSGLIEEETAIAAMRAGAHDYLIKTRLERLVPAVERELREARNRADHRAALAEMRESEARFRALAQNMPGMVFQLVRNDEGILRFIYVSDGCMALLGLKPPEVLATPERFTDMIVAEDRPGFMDWLHKAAVRFATFNWDGRITTAEGDVKWINIRCSPRFLDSGQVLWEGIMSNITQSKQHEMEVRKSRAQLAELSSHLQAAKEEERERIARDIHDVLGGTLVAMKIEVALLASKIPQQLNPLTQRARSIERLVDDAISTAGRVARDLRPGILKEFGLAAAVESQAEDFAERTGVPCKVLCADYDIDVDQETSIALFRIFQETLTNVSKHARANKVEVRLLQEAGEIVLEVSDDGRGIGPDDLSKPKSFGLRGMRERINSLNGSLTIESGPSGGTRLTVRAPAEPTGGPRPLDNSQHSK